MSAEASAAAPDASTGPAGSAPPVGEDVYESEISKIIRALLARMNPSMVPESVSEKETLQDIDIDLESLSAENVEQISKIIKMVRGINKRLESYRGVGSKTHTGAQKTQFAIEDMMNAISQLTAAITNVSAAAAEPESVYYVNKHAKLRDVQNFAQKALLHSGCDLDASQFLQFDILNLTGKELYDKLNEFQSIILGFVRRAEARARVLAAFEASCATKESVQSVLLTCQFIHENFMAMRLVSGMFNHSHLEAMCTMLGNTAQKHNWNSIVILLSTIHTGSIVALLNKDQEVLDSIKK